MQLGRVKQVHSAKASTPCPPTHPPTNPHLAPSVPPPPQIRTPAAEDRICGTIDIEKALTEGIKAYEPGLLARANRGIL